MTPSQRKKSDNEIVDGHEEIEPKLKYSQLGNDVKEILKVDSISCVALHSKFIGIGTEMGVIYLLDYLGNVTRELRVHDLAINQLSIDGNGDHIASCFDDGRVLVTGLYNSIHNQHLNMKRRARSVAIDPNYYKDGSGRKLIIGGRKMILHEKIPFSRWKSTVLEDATAEGGVKTIRWSPSGNLVLWASHRGLRIYDLVSKVSVVLSQFSMKAEIDLKFHVCWKGSHSVIVGWGDRIELFTIQKEISTPKLRVESAFSISVEAIVCGVGPLDDYIVVIGCGSGPNNINIGERPFLKVIHSDSGGFKDFRTDQLSLRAFENCIPTQYSLDCLTDEGMIVIVCPKDILVARPYEIDERVDWFLKHRKYQMALDVMQQSNIPAIRHTNMTVGMAFIDHLLESGKYEDAAALCSEIISDIKEDKLIWKQLLTKFANVNQLRAIADFLPCSWVSPLENDCYHTVLDEYLRMDHEGFLRKIKLWSHHLYNKKIIADSIWNHILNAEVKSNPTLLEALAIIYSHMKQYDKSLSLYAKLQSKYSFELIKKHNLYCTIHKSAKELMKLDSAQAIEAMLRSSEADPRLIVEDLSENHYFLYLYLDALHMKKPKQCLKFHTDLMWLYADFERKKLMGLLKNSDLYAIQKALEVCEKRHFIEETVYLLGRMGNTKEALKLIFSEIKDFDRAIDFCKEHDDEELWDDIIKFSLDTPRYINMLLKRIGTHVDPGEMIQRIDEKLEIPMLRDALVKMMQDYLLNVRIQETFKKIVSSDHYDLHNLQLSLRKRGVAIRYDNQCGACFHTLVVRNLKGLEYFYHPLQTPQ